MIKTDMRFAPFWVMPTVVETMDFDRHVKFSLGAKVYYGEHGFTSVNTEEQDPMGVCLRAPNDEYPYLCVQCWNDEKDLVNEEESDAEIASS